MDNTRLIRLLKLRELALSTNLKTDYQVNILLSELQKAMKYQTMSPYYILCGIQMLIKHGKPNFLEILFASNRMQNIEALLSLDKIPVETRIQVAQFVKVSQLHPNNDKRFSPGAIRHRSRWRKCRVSLVDTFTIRFMKQHMKTGIP